MDTRLASALTVLSITFTVLVAAYIAAGPAPAVYWAVVSLLALVCWLAFSPHDCDEQAVVVAPYILAVTLVLVLDTFRYLSGSFALLEPHLNSRFPLTEATWFAVFVTGPVSLMLLGGHCLSRGMALGSYMAWWTGVFAIADGLLQLRLEFLGGHSYNHFYFGGALAALALILVGVIICQSLLQHTSAKAPPVRAARPGLTSRERDLWSLLFVSLVLIYGVMLYQQAGPLPVVVIAGSMLGGLIGWRNTTALHPADPVKAVPLFLLLLALFYIHIGEEALTDFSGAIASISGTPWSKHEFTLLIGLAGPIVWIFSAWSLWRRQPFGNFIFWFLIAGMIVGEPAHLLVFPVMAMNKFGIGYEYFSGMYTALFPMIPAILALVMIVGNHRQRIASISA
jgi:hypothetical protein